MVERVLIQRKALALPLHGFIPFEAVGRKSRDNIFTRTFAAARRIDVLDAQPPFTAVGPRVAKTRERRDQGAEVQRAGGRRGETAAIGGRRAHASAVFT